MVEEGYRADLASPPSCNFDRRRCVDAGPGTEFAMDSPVDEGGIDPLVPLQDGRPLVPAQ